MVQPPEYRTPIQSPRGPPQCPPAPKKPTIVERYRMARAFELETEWPQAEISDINRIVDEEIREMLTNHPIAKSLMEYITKKIEDL